MTRFILIGTCAAFLAGGGVALAQMPPAGPPGDGPHGPMDGGGPMGHMQWRHHRQMAPGTAFRFKKGDAEVGIRCSALEPVQACVSGASALIDKLGIAAAAKP